MARRRGSLGPGWEAGAGMLGSSNCSTWQVFRPSAKAMYTQCTWPRPMADDFTGG